jgi:catalase
MHRTSISQAAAAMIVGLAFAGAAPAAFADDVSVPEQIVNGMNKVYGSHAGFRAAHAKGLVVEGSFVPTPAAAALSKASLFSGPAVPATVRFSDGSGVPDMADGNDNSNPHGMATKFHLADGGEMDVVTNSLKFFPVATGEDFRDLFAAIAAAAPDSPHPNSLEKFVTAHPSVPAATATIATPSSFARENYFGINAFVFIDKAGKRQPFRFQILPVAGIEHLSHDDAAKQSADFLMEELPARLAKRPVAYHLLAQLAEPGDPTNDATKPWPAHRKTVELGTITLTKAVADSATAEKGLLYLPGNLTDGVEPSDDPLIDVRNQAYAISFGRRQQ